VAADGGRNREEVSGGDSLPGNNVQTFREGLMMSKAELARKAGLSTLTIDRVESGRPCRLDTKRKILLALGLRVGDKDRVFGADEPVAMPADAMARVASSAQADEADMPLRSNGDASAMTTASSADRTCAGTPSEDSEISDATIARKGGASR
jgi:DNA-binding XRE family transcriptional regulator